MTQQIFEDMIGTAPPSTVDVEAVIRRERRVIRWRRTAGAGTAGALVLALTIGVAAAIGDTNGPPGSVGRRSVAPAATATEPAPPPPPLTKERADALLQEMRDVIHRLSPSAKISGFMKTGPFGQYESGSPSGMPDGIPDGEEYNAYMFVRVGKREGALAIHLIRFGDSVFQCIGLTGQCSETPGPNGSTVLVNKDVKRGQDQAYTVNVTYPDGMRVWVINNNARDADSVHYDRPPLTVEQVKQIALDPDLIPHP
jgi:hypothetical protein